MSDDSQPSTSTPPVFYPVLPLKLVALTVISGGFYLYYWMYRSWRAYREADGYSARAFWRTIQNRTGYRPSPFWRGLLWSYYAFALFPAIDRECRTYGEKLAVSPVVLAIAVILTSYTSSAFAGAALLPALALVPVQLGVNRVNSNNRYLGWGLQPVEALLVVAGAIYHWGNI